MTKLLSVTIKISDGEREEVVTYFVPDNLLKGVGRLNDQRQDEAVHMTSACFTKVYRDFMKGGDDNARGTQEGSGEECQAQRSSEEASRPNG